MKKKYSALEMEIVEFDTEDVIVTSGEETRQLIIEADDEEYFSE